MVTCASCQFVYLNPRPAEEALIEFYQDYLPRETSSIEDWKRMMGPSFRRSSRLIRRYNKDKGRLLDVGTGFGFFLAEMKHQGWEVEGVEISQKGVNYGREVLKQTVHPGLLEAIGFPEKVFDVVTAFYVIEHLPDPMAFLRECYRILKPGGLLLLRYPHTTPIKTLLRTLRVKNRLYDLPAHLSDFWQLKGLYVVNIGAAGTLVVRAPTSQARLRTELRRRLPFETEVVICQGRDIVRLEAGEPGLGGRGPAGGGGDPQPGRRCCSGARSPAVAAST